MTEQCTEDWWAKNDQQDECKLLCGHPALRGWRYANMCEECYTQHQAAMKSMWVL